MECFFCIFDQIDAALMNRGDKKKLNNFFFYHFNFFYFMFEFKSV